VPIPRIKDDIINHPKHYTRGKIEVWDFILDQQLDYLSGSAVKYICRHGHKDPSKTVEDLQKAIAYLNKRIECLKNSTL